MQTYQIEDYALCGWSNRVIWRAVCDAHKSVRIKHDKCWIASIIGGSLESP